MSETEDGQPQPGVEPEPAQPSSPEPAWTLPFPMTASEQPLGPHPDDVIVGPDTGSLPAEDPWSKPSAFPPAAAVPALEKALPRQAGWEWSRNAAPVFAPPSPAMQATAAISASDPVAQPETTLGRLGLDVLALFMALIGGLLALVGAFFQELQSGIGIAIAILGAPVIEEALKPSGIYLLLLKWPRALRGRLHTALLCSISGAVFGVIESLIYVQLYYPEGNDNFVLFRFTVTPIMHAVASFIVGFGLTRGLLDWANGRAPLPKTTRNCFLIGMGLHAVYNTSMVVLSLLGVMDFLET